MKIVKVGSASGCDSHTFVLLPIIVYYGLYLVQIMTHVCLWLMHIYGSRDIFIMTRSHIACFGLYLVKIMAHI